ncbi:hypothetical protein CAPTEDRAFT_35459, partial [Capitella teleta]
DSELVADPDDCKKYFQCLNNQWAHFTCPGDSTFDSKANASSWCCFSLVAHPSTDPCNRPPLCLSGNDSELVADPDDCEKYFQCLNNQWAHFTCPGDSTFDSKANACATNHGNCFPACPVYTGASTVSATPDPDDCEKYFQCLNNQWAHFTCPGDSTFDSKANACATNHETVSPPALCIQEPPRCQLLVGPLPDPDDCHYFYVCNNGQWGRGRCPDGFFFDQDVLNCDDSDDNCL